MRIDIADRPDLPAKGEVLVTEVRTIPIAGTPHVVATVIDISGLGHLLTLHAGEEFRLLARPSRRFSRLRQLLRRRR